MSEHELFQSVMALGGAVRLEVPSSQFKQLQEKLEAAGCFVAEVDRAPVFNKETLMHALYQSCRFPAYFGFNWDALADCLNDFSWAEARGYFLVFNDWVLLEHEAPLEAKVFLDILAEAQQRWAETETPFRLLTLARG